MRGGAFFAALTIRAMHVQIGQKVYVPNPEGEPILATVLGFGEPDDAVEVVITTSRSRVAWRSSATRRATARASSPVFRIT